MTTALLTTTPCGASRRQFWHALSKMQTAVMLRREPGSYCTGWTWPTRCWTLRRGGFWPGLQAEGKNGITPGYFDCVSGGDGGAPAPP